LRTYNADILIGLYDDLNWHASGVALRNMFVAAARSMVLFKDANSDVLLHELGHLFQGVKEGAPNKDGGAHCTDTNCIMDHNGGSYYCSYCAQYYDTPAERAFLFNDVY